MITSNNFFRLLDKLEARVGLEAFISFLSFPFLDRSGENYYAY